MFVLLVIDRGRLWRVTVGGAWVRASHHVFSKPDRFFFALEQVRERGSRNDRDGKTRVTDARFINLQLEKHPHKHTHEKWRRTSSTHSHTTHLQSKLTYTLLTNHMLPKQQQSHSPTATHLANIGHPPRFFTHRKTNLRLRSFLSFLR